MGSLPGLFYENPGSLETARFTVAGMVLKLDNPRPWLWVLQRRRSGWRPTLGCRLPIWLMARGCWRDENWSKSCTIGTVRWCRYMIGTFFLQSPWIGRRISYLNRRNQSLHTWRADNPHRPFCFPLQPMQPSRKLTIAIYTSLPFCHWPASSSCLDGSLTLVIFFTTIHPRLMQGVRSLKHVLKPRYRCWKRPSILNW